MGVESNFSVKLWSKLKFCSRTLAFTWTKLNNEDGQGLISELGLRTPNIQTVGQTKFGGANIMWPTHNIGTNKL